HSFHTLLGITLLGALALWATSAQALPELAVRVTTSPLHQYEGAPATPDADDPAVWVHPMDPAQSLVIGTLKNAGLIVYNLQGQAVQPIAPPNLPIILPADPPSPAGVNPQAPRPCAESASGETFGRFNNVDVAYSVRLGVERQATRADVAVVSDRGC